MVQSLDGEDIHRLNRRGLVNMVEGIRPGYHGSVATCWPYKYLVFAVCLLRMQYVCRETTYPFARVLYR